MACKQPDEGRTKEPVVSQYGQSYEDGTKDVAAREPLRSIFPTGKSNLAAFLTAML